MRPLHRTGRGMPLFIFIVLSSQWTWGRAPGQAGQAQPPAAQGGTAPDASQEIQTQKIAVPAQAEQPVTIGNVTGSLQADEVRAMLKQVRFSEYRINDLLTDVHPEKWNLPATTLASFRQTLETLRQQVGALEQWRGQFEQRTDSLYLGFQTYSTMNAVLPRLSGVTHSIAEHETAEYAAQFSRAADKLFDLQQNIGRYVSSLMQTEDQVLVDYTSNMAACQRSLSEAMRGKSARPKYMRNSQPIRPQRRSTPSKQVKPAGSEKPGKTEAKPK